MSGGVDSSVAACILAHDYDIVGVTMRLWSTDHNETSPNQQGCCSIDDIEDARRVCRTLNIPHYVLDARTEFRAHVIDYFLSEYRNGRTPHPCIACNDRIKFNFLLRRAAMMNADYIATGHYARIEQNPRGEMLLRKGADPRKDQSYVLFGLDQQQLRRILLPVGSRSKDAIRNIARCAGLHLADKPDSQEICFIPGGDYRQFINQEPTNHESQPVPGPILDPSGRVVGSHPGVEFFTVGQRKGIGVSPRQLGLPEGSKLYVTRVNAAERAITVGPASELLARNVLVRDVHYISGEPPPAPVRVDAKVRYNAPPAPAELLPASPRATLRFHEPQRAISPGQAAVFYQNDRVLGGGYIDGPAAP